MSRYSLFRQIFDVWPVFRQILALKLAWWLQPLNLSSPVPDWPKPILDANVVFPVLPLIARFLEIVGKGVATLVGLVAIAVAVLWLLVPDFCGNLVLSESLSPNGKLKAVVFSRDCGASTDFSTHISLLKAGDRLSNTGGNLFVADSNHGKAPANQHGGPVVTIRWVSDEQLRVERHALARVFKSVPSHRDIEVEYADFN
ncbi:MAG: hypothetical protein JNL84_10415 [Candidatus Accumulibacter sp.]|nr:hypothetical protein [Accumulibacter sp.]